MTRATQTRLHRHFDIETKVVAVNGKLQQKSEFTRKPKVPAKPLATKPCAYCKAPMFVSDGQIAHMHKECRKVVRRKKNQGKKRDHAKGSTV